ncbi:DNA polymerase III subunit gamma/tau [Peptococcaceae bacterium]|nr:DNA polymerase III subunit gamma/tau [Peptococcaceae bacterium]
MGYRALYREYRPQKFTDIAGQQHITRTLQNAISGGRINHAYLFCGPRGTGKTTTAKVLAKALNCLDLQKTEPCNQCSNCVAINDNASVDTLEIDAASNRGIDDIRELREQVKYAPAKAKYRIYIIDEVHMLTIEAFNALLKTLEEPPAHVIFILATTEAQKLPLTILSRCQRFDFRRIGINEMLPRLKQVAAGAGLQVDEQALLLIAGNAGGGLRDALSILEQGSVFGNDTVTVDVIHAILGTVKSDLLSTMVGYLLAGNAADALALLNDIFQKGKDLRLFAKELSAYLRSLMLYLISGNLPADAFDNTMIEADVQKLKTNTENILPNIAEIIEKLSRLEYDMKWSTQPKLLLELVVVKITTADYHNLSAKVAKLEQLLKEQPVRGLSVAVSNNTEEVIIPDKHHQQVPVLDQPPDAKEQLVAVEQIILQPARLALNDWKNILERVKKLSSPAYAIFCEIITETIMVDASAQKNQTGQPEKVLTIGFQPRHNFHKARAEQSNNREILEQALNKEFGGSWTLKIITAENAPGEIPAKEPVQPQNSLVQKAAEIFGKEKIIVKD